MERKEREREKKERKYDYKMKYEQLWQFELFTEKYTFITMKASRQPIK